MVVFIASTSIDNKLASLTSAHFLSFIVFYIFYFSYFFLNWIVRCTGQCHNDMLMHSSGIHIFDIYSLLFLNTTNLLLKQWRVKDISVNAYCSRISKCMNTIHQFPCITIGHSVYHTLECWKQHNPQWLGQYRGYWTPSLLHYQTITSHVVKCAGYTCHCCSRLGEIISTTVKHII